MTFILIISRIPLYISALLYLEYIPALISADTSEEMRLLFPCFAVCSISCSLLIWLVLNAFQAAVVDLVGLKLSENIFMGRVGGVDHSEVGLKGLKILVEGRI
jgi:hypothetical protein